MKRYIKFLILMVLGICFVESVKAQSAAPSATYTTVEGEEIDDASTPQDAPLKAHFSANPEPLDLEGYNARWEWKIWDAQDKNNILVHRFEQDIDYTFVKSGTFLVQLYATFTKGDDVINWPEPGDAEPMRVVITESKLEMPNAFSPNGDGYNDIYNAKSGYRSIVSFHAAIYNRWGQKLYSWTDPDREKAGWDGTVNGHVVSDGVYYVVVNAKGADGHHYKIRKDVNVLTGYHNRDGKGGED